MVRDGIVLRVGDVLPVNAQLDLGSLTESVQVSAQSTLLETETSSSGAVGEGQTLHRMLLYQRYVLNSLRSGAGHDYERLGLWRLVERFDIAGQRATGQRSSKTACSPTIRRAAAEEM